MDEKIELNMEKIAKALGAKRIGKVNINPLDPVGSLQEAYLSRQKQIRKENKQNNNQDT